MKGGLLRKVLSKQYLESRCLCKIMSEGDKRRERTVKEDE